MKHTKPHRWEGGKVCKDCTMPHAWMTHGLACCYSTWHRAMVRDVRHLVNAKTCMEAVALRKQLGWPLRLEEREMTLPRLAALQQVGLM